MGVNTGIFGDQGSTKTTRKAPGNSTPLLLAAADGSRVSLLLNNLGSVSVSVGQKSTLTTSADSNALPATQNMPIWGIAAKAAWYGIAASGTGDISVVEEFAH
jgi:hypothetical protein